MLAVILEKNKKSITHLVAVTPHPVAVAPQMSHPDSRMSHFVKHFVEHCYQVRYVGCE